MAQGAGVGDENCPARRLGQGTGIGTDIGCCCCPARPSTEAAALKHRDCRWKEENTALGEAVLGLAEQAVLMHGGVCPCRAPPHQHAAFFITQLHCKGTSDRPTSRGNLQPAKFNSKILTGAKSSPYRDEQGTSCGTIFTL